MTSPPDPSPPEAPPAAKRPLRLSRQRLWLFRGVLLLAVALGQEVVFRAMFPRPEVQQFNRIHYQQMAQSHPQFKKTMERGLVYDRLWIESRPDGFSEVHNLNLYGFRGPDFRIARTPGQRRILVVGDSVVEGEGVPDSQTITAEWSRILSREGSPAEVINLGVIAASMPHLWILLRDAVALLRPDDVVLALYCNDLPAPFIYDSLNQPPKRFEPIEVDPWEPRLVDLIDRAIYEKPIYRRWFHPAIRFFAPIPDETNPWADGRPCPSGLEKALYDDMRAGRINPWLHHQSEDMPGLLSHDFSKDGSPQTILQRMADLSKIFEARMMVAYIPFCGVVHTRYAKALVEMGMKPDLAAALPGDPKYRAQNRILAEVCGQLNLPLADATPDLEAAEAAGTPHYWAYDTHPNAQGYAVIARRIHETWSTSLRDARKPSSQSGAQP